MVSMIPSGEHYETEEAAIAEMKRRVRKYLEKNGIPHNPAQGELANRRTGVSQSILWPSEPTLPVALTLFVLLPPPQDPRVRTF